MKLSSSDGTRGHKREQWWCLWEGQRLYCRPAVTSRRMMEQMETEGKRRTKYYNKRPAGEKKGADAMEGSASLLSRGASRALCSWIGQSRSTDEAGGEMGWETGGYLQRLNVWRQRKPACTTAGPRLIGWSGRRSIGEVVQSEEGNEWPRNRRPGILNKRFTNEIGRAHV